MRVVVLIDHLFVGDLLVRLTHDGATGVQLLDRPGTTDPSSDFGCDGVNVDVVFDDGAGAAAEDECAATVPTIDGVFSPIGGLSDFIAESISGAWELEVEDGEFDDEGIFRRWCLIPTVGDPPNTPPDALDDHIFVAKGQAASLLVSGADSVLANDSDGEGDSLSVNTTPVVPPAHGLLSLNADGTFLYTHGDSYTPSDFFVYEVCDDGTPSECDEATVHIDIDLGDDPFCNRPEAAIPDGDEVTGVTDSIVLPDNGAIADLNLLVQIDHSFVGDLKASLSNGTIAALMLDQPGAPDIDIDGCPEDNIEAVFDDEAVQPAEDICIGADPAISGPVIPTESLSVYDATNIARTWQLTVYDVTTSDMGVLKQWCLLPTLESNRAPTADDQSVATSEDVAVAIVLTGDDLDFDPITFAIDTAPTQGVLSGAAPDLTYTPNAHINGADSFTFTTFDGTLTSPPATVTITIEAVNDPPVADDQTVTVSEDESVDIVLTATDVEGEPLEFGLVTVPAHGVLSGTPPSLTYAPDEDFNGTDSFAFDVRDPSLASDLGVVSITVEAVNDVPVADDQAVGTDEEVAVEITLTASDADEGATLSYAIVAPPAHGSLDTSLLPVVTYTPEADYAGPDSFTFQANDGEADSNIATVSITVNGINDPPVTLGEHIIVQKGLSTSELAGGGTSLLANDTDPEGDTLSVSATPVTLPTNGSVVLNSDGSFTYTQNDSLTTTDYFEYEVCDDGVPSECGTAGVSVDIDLSISPYCNAPDAAIPDDDPDTGLADSIVIDGSGAITDMGLLLFVEHSRVGDLWAAVTHEDTATDVELLDRPGVPDLGPLGCEGDHIDAVFDDDAATAAEDQCNDIPPAIAGSVAPIDLLSLFHDENINGTWTLTIADGAASEIGTLLQWCLIPVIAGNTAPVADSQAVTTDEDTNKAITLTGSDADLDPLTFAIDTPPAHGVLTGAAPNVVYEPNADYNGVDSFTFTANDGALTSAPATVTITVDPINDEPAFTAGADQDLLEDAGAQAVAGWATGITAGPPDEAAQSVAFNITGNSNPTLFAAAPAVSPAGDLTYTPAADANGMADITIEAQDDGGTINPGDDDTSPPQVFSITILAVNDAPGFTPGGAVEVQEDSGGYDAAWASGLSAGPPDEAGQVLTFNTVGNSNPGLFASGPVLTPTGNLQFEPAPDAVGSALVDVVLMDDGGTASGGVDQSAPQSISITVNNENDAPEADNQVVHTDQGVAVAITLTGSDIDDDDLTFSIVTPPGNGSLSGDAPNVVYSPDASFVGTDSFTFIVNDGTVDSAPATVTVNVGGLPDRIHADGFESE
jgi:subtilisin-like proprotein convertase family protein